MITIKIGYDRCMQGGFAQWDTIYIKKDFTAFYDYDGEEYYKNKLAPVNYNPIVEKMRQEFVAQFKFIKNIDDLINDVRGLLYVYDNESGFEWW